MDTDIRLVSANLTESLQSYIERRLCPSALSALAAEPVLRPEEKRGL